jgi:hypothetical protein
LTGKKVMCCDLLFKFEEEFLVHVVQTFECELDVADSLVVVIVRIAGLAMKKGKG